MTDDLLQHQIDYYRARAGEYDEWFYRQGRFDHGKQLNDQWFTEAAQVRGDLLDLGPFDQILELACGTGIWTQELLKIGNHVTAVDASPEVLEINRAKLQIPQVQYQQADIFAWSPERTYDLVFFSFWLSHVPPDLLQPFLQTVYTATAVGGTVFMIDSRRETSSTASNHILPEQGDIYGVRKLNDGREFKIVKIFYDPAPLRQALGAAGFDVEVHTTDSYFIYAVGKKHA